MKSHECTLVSRHHIYNLSNHRYSQSFKSQIFTLFFSHLTEAGLQEHCKNIYPGVVYIRAELRQDDRRAGDQESIGQNKRDTAAAHNLTLKTTWRGTQLLHYVKIME